MDNGKPTNAQIADLLDDIARQLERGEENPFRVRAYREGARTVRKADCAVADLVTSNGTDTLQSMPNIAEGLAAVIGEYVSSGQSSLHAQLRAESSPQSTLVQVPGIGKTLAARIVEQLDIKTLPQLEQAAHDGRLAAVEGFGSRRVQAVRSSLAGILSASARRRSRQRTKAATTHAGQRPAVAALLDVDQEYRRRAAAGELEKIAPRRFNPQNEAWLPILHTTRGEWRFTVLFSNTARAHELNKTDDWVVIYYRPQSSAADHNAEAEEQNTVVTEAQGPLHGRRVVRGREAECQKYYKE
ncbi:MAG: helix-hairpin-helix domain-containing protein [Caldilineaceae bacterium]